MNNFEESLNYIIKQKNFLLKGIEVSPGIIIGKTVLFDTNEIEVPAIRLNTEAAINQEIKKLKQALIKSKQQLLKPKRKSEHMKYKEAYYMVDTEILILEDRQPIVRGFRLGFLAERYSAKCCRTFAAI